MQLQFFVVRQVVQNIANCNTASLPGLLHVARRQYILPSPYLLLLWLDSCSNMRYIIVSYISWTDWVLQQI